jgi:hypothetical protein
MQKGSSANIFPRAAHYMSKSRMWLASRGLVTPGMVHWSQGCVCVEALIRRDLSPEFSLSATGVTVNFVFTSFKRAKQFKYVGTILADQNWMHEKIKSRLKARNACCHWVQNLSSYTFLSKNIKIKIQYNSRIRGFGIRGFSYPRFTVARKY